jgi:hypothetical protein
MAATEALPLLLPDAGTAAALAEAVADVCLENGMAALCATAHQPLLPATTNNIIAPATSALLPPLSLPAPGPTPTPTLTPDPTKSSSGAHGKEQPPAAGLKRPWMPAATVEAATPSMATDEDPSTPSTQRAKLQPPRARSVSFAPELVTLAAETFSAEDYDRSFSLNAYTCDRCCYFIAGPRLHCNACDSYDLCGACFNEAFEQKPRCPHPSTRFFVVEEGQFD